MSDEVNFEEELNALVSELEGTDKEKLQKLVKESRNSRKKFEKSILSLQESLDYLRVCIKYQVFDLEATRRENAYLRKLLEEEKE